MSVGTISSPDDVITNQIVNNTTGLITYARVQNAVETLAALPHTVQTGSYTAAITDRGTCVEMNSASGLNFTVPPNSSVAFPTDSKITICQMGAGQVTIVAGAGVTLRTPSSLTARAQYSTLQVRKRATDEWVVSGDMT